MSLNPEHLKDLHLIDNRRIAELYVDSRHSIGNNPADVQINFSHIFGQRKFNRIKLKYACIPNVEYPVGAWNNSLIFQENGVDTDILITLSEGAYTGDLLAFELQNAMNAAGANTYEVLYESLNKRLAISITAGTSFSIITGTTLNILGWTATGFITSYIGVNPIRVDGVEYMNVEITGYNLMNYSSGNKHDIIACIPIDAPYGSMLYYKDESDDYLTLRETHFKYINIRLLAPDGRVITLPDNCDTAFVFMFY